MNCKAAVLAGSITTGVLYSATSKQHNGGADRHSPAPFAWALNLSRINDSLVRLCYEIRRTTQKEALKQKKSHLTSFNRDRLWNLVEQCEISDEWVRLLSPGR